MENTLELKVGEITIKHDRVTGGTLKEQKNLKLNQMAQDALVNLIVVIMQEKEK